MNAIRYGLGRHINDKRTEKGLPPIDIIKEFTVANDMFRAVAKVLQENDKVSIEHYRAIEGTDLKT